MSEEHRGGIRHGFWRVNRELVFSHGVQAYVLGVATGAAALVLATWQAWIPQELWGWDIWAVECQWGPTPVFGDSGTLLLPGPSVLAWAAVAWFGGFSLAIAARAVALSRDWSSAAGRAYPLIVVPCVAGCLAVLVVTVLNAVLGLPDWRLAVAVAFLAATAPTVAVVWRRSARG